MIPAQTDLWFLPLGGCGEIGMNMNLYGHDGRWLMVDCGVTFEKGTPQQGNRVQMPDIEFIRQHRDSLLALVLTHGHEDHLGAVAYLWPQLSCPVYCTPFAAEVLKRKLQDQNLLGRVPLYVVDPAKPMQIGPFAVQWIPLTHSIPEPFGLTIECPAGKVFHTADWKLDPKPVLGPAVDPANYQRLAQLGIDAMVCDSTNATQQGHSVSEGQLAPGLKHWIQQATGRVIVSCFASNLARIKTLHDIALECDRHPAMLGRSLQVMLQAARSSQHWPAKDEFISNEHLGFLPKETVLIMATGSQGEPNAMLARLARDAHPDITLEEGDTVIFSSKVIPGNEEAVEQLIRAFDERGIQVIQEEQSALPIHASGHPSQDELTLMYQWVQPRIAIPVHGEAQHMAAHAQLAAELGIERQLLGENGDLFFIAPVPGIRRQAAPVGRLEWLPGTHKKPGQLKTITWPEPAVV